MGKRGPSHSFCKYLVSTITYDEKTCPGVSENEFEKSICIEKGERILSEVPCAALCSNNTLDCPLTHICKIMYTLDWIHRPNNGQSSICEHPTFT